MKRIGNLFDRIADAGNVYAAAHRAASGKREQKNVCLFLENIDVEVAGIVAGLLEGTWVFGKYSEFLVYDPKQRRIQAPCFRDRVMHYAILRVVGEVFENGATYRSYACRKGRGQHRCLTQVRQWMKRGDWFLKLDVKKFYDSIDHVMLGNMLARRFREKRLLHLFDALLDSYQTVFGKGLPIGALSSQYLGNFYLDMLDHQLIEMKGLKHVRYMDDILIMGSKERLEQVMPYVRELVENLELELKPAILNRCSVGVPFLGFVVYPDRMRLDGRGRKRLNSRYNEIEKQVRGGGINELERQDRLSALFAHAGQAGKTDEGWRRGLCQRWNFREEQETSQYKHQPRAPRRLVEQLCEELPRRLSEQEQAGQSQQEQRLSCGLVSRHGDDVLSPDDALSCASVEDKTMRKSSRVAEICSGGAKKGAGEAADFEEGGGA